VRPWNSPGREDPEAGQQVPLHKSHGELLPPANPAQDLYETGRAGFLERFRRGIWSFRLRRQVWLHLRLEVGARGDAQTAGGRSVMRSSVRSQAVIGTICRTLHNAKVSFSFPPDPQPPLLQPTRREPRGTIRYHRAPWGKATFGWEDTTLLPRSVVSQWNRRNRRFSLSNSAMDLRRWSLSLSAAECEAGEAFRPLLVLLQKICIQTAPNTRT
jgi:hypothetical protein